MIEGGGGGGAGVVGAEFVDERMWRVSVER